MKSEKCIFVRYSKDVKGYRLLQPHSHDIIIRIDVKFDENLLACEPNLAGVPSFTCEPDSTIVPSSSSSSFLDRFPTLVSDDDSEDENPPPPVHVPPIAPAPILPLWVRSTCEAAGDIASDPRDQRRTRSQIQRASSLWLKFPRIMIQKILQKLQKIQIGMYIWMKNIVR